MPTNLESTLEEGDTFPRLPNGVRRVFTFDKGNGKKNHLCQTPTDWVWVSSKEGHDSDRRYTINAVGDLRINIEFSHIKDQLENTDLTDDERQQIKDVYVKEAKRQFNNYIEEDGKVWAVETESHSLVRINPVMHELIEQKAVEGLENPPDLNIRYVAGNLEIHKPSPLETS